MSEWVSESVGGWVGEWVSGWVGEWGSEGVNEWVSEWVSVSGEVRRCIGGDCVSDCLRECASACMLAWMWGRERLNDWARAWLSSRMLVRVDHWLQFLRKRRPFRIRPLSACHFPIKDAAPWSGSFASPVFTLEIGQVCRCIANLKLMRRGRCR